MRIWLNHHFKLSGRKCCWFAVLLITVLLFQPGYASDVVRLTLKPAAKVNADTIRLSDIASAADAAASRWETIGAIEVARSPQPGQTRFVSVDYIRIRLKQAGIDMGGILFKGPADVRVTRQATALPVKPIREAIQTAILRQMPWPPEDVTISAIGFDENIQMPTGELSYRIVPNRGEDFLGKTILNLHLYVDGRVVRKVWAHANISVMADVVTLVRPLGKHQHVEMEDLALKRRDLAGLPSDAIRRIEDAVGNRALRMIYPDTVLRTSMISMPPVVNRGDVVKIVASSGAMTITATGLVKEQGRKGDMVRVVNTDSKRIVTARVAGPGTVEVDF